MKYSPVFKKRIGCDDSEQVFLFLINNLKPTVTKWDYFVNWAKVFGNIKDIEIDLNTLNYLIGKENIEKEFALLLEKQPSIARLVPVLIACREEKFNILTDYSEKEFKYDIFDFGKSAKLDISKVIEFAKSTGFLELLRAKRIKSIVDYVIGVEVGLDSNGRKNRSGESMEAIVEFFIKGICQRNQIEYIKEATAKKVKQEWGLTLEVDKSRRRVDFIVKNNSQLFLIETNFYSGTGSKLKSTAGEYKAMYDFWQRGGHEFIWITDGFGWAKTRLPLEETFEYTDYVLNLEMVSKGLLEDIITESS